MTSEERHAPWHYTEFGVVCSCGLPMRDEVCPSTRYAAHPYGGIDEPCTDDVPDGYWDSAPGDRFSEDASLTLYWPLTGPKPRVVPQVIMHVVEPSRVESLALAHPCVRGQHAWAYLTRGGIACARCGVRLA